GAVKGRLERGRALLHDRLVGRGLAPSAVLAALEASRVTGRLPPEFLAATLREATSFALGGSLPVGTSGKVAAIAETGVAGVRLTDRREGRPRLAAPGRGGHGRLRAGPPETGPAARGREPRPAPKGRRPRGKEAGGAHRPPRRPAPRGGACPPGHDPLARRR